jgi:arsenate reductase (thioredoxin)
MRQTPLFVASRAVTCLVAGPSVGTSPRSRLRLVESHFQPGTRPACSTLAHRFARERLKALGRAVGPASELPDVVFISLGDTGRGQIAVAPLTLRSEGSIVAHSAGSTIEDKVDPAVIEVMAELGVDLAEAYAKPLSREVLDAADIVVTMGRSVGAVEVPSGTRHIDWRVGDPSGAPVAEVRRVRDDIDRRVGGADCRAGRRRGVGTNGAECSSSRALPLA